MHFYKKFKIKILFFSAVGNEDDEPVHIDSERQRLVQMYEEKIEELIKQHDNELSEEKRSNNNRVEALLQRLAECNTRYCDLMPDYEQVSDTSNFNIKFFCWSHNAD
jgi:predicted metalloendopeptidase